jgi:L-ascorbate metabolism protein UlaG (beta-lactamase superfamily)
MRVTILGHAGLFIETDRASVLIDPILHERPLAGGCIGHSAARDLDVRGLSAPTILLITHAHIDHFDKDSLELVDKRTRVIGPPDKGLIDELQALGFKDVQVLEPWQRVQIEDLIVAATPSMAEVDEIGVFLATASARFWHVADSEVSEAHARRLLEELGRPDLMTVKFQPSQASYAPLRNLGATFDKREVIEWLEATGLVRPRLAIPYAAGMRYCGRHAWMNRHAFPYTDGEIAALLSERLAPDGRSHAVRPGDVVEIDRERIDLLTQASPLVRHVPERSVQPRWEPLAHETLAGLDSDAERTELKARFEAFVRDDFGPWMAQRRHKPGSPYHRYLEYGVVWQLDVHTGPAERLQYFIDFGRAPLQLREGLSPRANFFVHLSGQALADILSGTSTSESLYFGDARFYEKILTVKDGRLWAPPNCGWALFEELSEPLTYFLRHYHRAAPAPRLRGAG